MPRHRRVKRRTLGKDPRSMVKSLITSQIDGGIGFVETVKPTSTLSAAGGGTHVFEGADIGDTCSPNSIIKYLNIRLQCAIKSDEAEFRPGWIEYGVVLLENQSSAPSAPGTIATNFGTQTLPQMLRNLYRNHCLWTGAEAISADLPRVINLHLKLPDKWCKNQLGTYWVCYYAFRSSKSTDTVTTVKFIYSHEYKVYI